MLEFELLLQQLQKVWRNKLWIVLSIAAGLGLSYLALSLIPPAYRADTVVMVEPQKVPADYVKTTVTTELQDRLKTLESQVMRRENFRQIVDEFDLIEQVDSVSSTGEALRYLRRNLRVSVERNTIFRVFFSGRDPDLVAGVANRVAELFIEQNLQQRESQAQSTTEFLRSELEELRVQLEEKEIKVSDYRLRNAGSLPDQREANLKALTQLEALLRRNEEQSEQVEMQLLLLESDARAYGGSQVMASPNERVQRIQDLNRELTEARSRYTDRHPEVVRLRSQLEALLGQGPIGPTEESDREVPSNTDPVVEAQIAAKKMEQTSLDVDRDEILQEMSRYQARLERTPRIEQELIGLTRDYDNLRGSYQSLRAKQLEARLAENLEKTQKSERFQILQHAEPPESPYFPNKVITLFFGVLAGLVAGIGIAFIREEMTQSFNDFKTLERAFPGLPFVTYIPHIMAEERDFSTGMTMSERETA